MFAEGRERADRSGVWVAMEQQSAAKGRRKPGPETTFVELPPVAIGACDCTLELEDTAGSKMRVHLKGIVTPDLAALGRSFWNPRP